MKGWILKSALIIILIVLAVFLYIVGKEHIIFVENNTFTFDGKEYEPYGLVRVSLDGGEFQEIKKPRGRSLGRIKVSTTGLNHKIVAEVLDDDDKVVERKETKFKVKNNQPELLINVPALMNDVEDWLTSNQKVVFVENTAFKVDGKTYEPYEFIRVVLDRSVAFEIKAPGGKETGKKNGIVTDLKHSIYIEIMNKEEKILESKELIFTVDHSQDQFYINIPALMNDAEGWLREYE